MKAIHFDFEHCFGIPKLDATIKFDSCNVAMIYAPNGTMKTSFANTLQLLSAQTNAEKKIKKSETKEHICDRLHKDLPSKSDVTTEDGNKLNPESIFVANPDNKKYDATDSVTSFLASSELKERYDKAIKNINRAKDQFLKQYKRVSLSTDCEEELVSCFATVANPSIYDIIDTLKKEIDKTDHPFYRIRFNDIFDKTGLVKTFLENNATQLSAFVSRYKNLLSQSVFFHVSKDGKSTFGTYQAKILSNGLKDDSFFKVNHKLQLQDNSCINSRAELDEKISNEITAIESDTELQTALTSIIDQIDGNAALRAFKDCITSNISILGELGDYENFRKKLLLGYLSDDETKRAFEELYSLYASNKEELMQIIHDAQAEQTRWKNILELFNARFYVPFTVKIDNQKDIILKQQTPKLTFQYNDPSGNPISQSKDELLNILSNGEQRAFFILQMLFEIEARKDQEYESLLILDDISDSFDYQNKFAIIEYINDIANNNNGKFKVILLTHNFDFYRNASLRLRINNCFMATKNSDGHIALSPGIYVAHTPFENEIKDVNTSNFICMIPFVRNIVEYTEGSGSDDYMTLTNCLHLMDRTEGLTDKIIDEVIRHHIKNPKYNYTATGDNLLNLIYREAESIVQFQNDEENLRIENKVVLSIAIRLKAETYIKGQLLALGETEETLKSTKNQTNQWIGKMKKVYPSHPNLKTLERVNMMTPECIHLNSFMFEPLIDMSIRHLVQLYKDVDGLP
ncbi:MAG: hypothetical protein NC324_06890 [Bacteroides sp.]|nr:hypothetical protein [Bacteroides sp.]